MPLYLVRWPNLSAAFVNAADEDDLVDQLDMLEDPSGCRWMRYRGPLHIELDLPIQFERKHSEGTMAGTLEDRYAITEAPDELSRHSVEVSIPSTDTTDAMLDEIWKFAFPNLSNAIEENEYVLTGEQVRSSP